MMYGFSAVQKDPASPPGLLFFIQRPGSAGKMRNSVGDSVFYLRILPPVFFFSRALTCSSL